MSARTRQPAGSRPATRRPESPRAVPPRGTTQKDVDRSLGLGSVAARLPMQLFVAGLVGVGTFLIALISAGR
jgi:hypothetical protein